MEIFNDEHFNLVFVFTKIKKSKLIPINYLLKEKVILLIFFCNNRIVKGNYL